MSDGNQSSEGDETLPTIPPVLPRSRHMTDTVSAVGPQATGPAWLGAAGADASPPTERRPAVSPPPPPPPPPPRAREDSTQMGFGSGFPPPPDPQPRDSAPPFDPSRSIDLTHSVDDDGIAPAPVWSPSPLGQTIQGHAVRPPNPIENSAPSVQPSRPPPPPKRSKPKPSRPVVQPLELIWVDTDRAEDVASHPEWKDLLPEVDPPSVDWKERAEFGYGADLFDELHEPASPDGRPAPERDALKVLQKAMPQMLTSLPTTVSESLRNDDPTPLIAAAGQLVFAFDPRKHLETLLSAAKPFSKGHRRLAEAIQHADDMLEAPIEAVPEVARRVIQQLRSAWNDTNVNLPANYLDQTAERVLLTQRAYDRRELLAGKWLRTTLTEEVGRGELVSVTAYLPADIEKRLPLFSHFNARLLADALPRQDGQETPRVCLKVIAIARVITDGP